MSFLKKAISRAMQRPRRLGAQGESALARRIGRTRLFGYDGKLLRNLYVPMGGGRTCEIDLLFLTRKGLFVVESKNYSGYILGAESQQTWIQSLYAGKNWLGRKKTEQHPFYNPIWQNQAHIRHLTTYLEREVPMFSIVVFSDRCQIGGIETDSDRVWICQEKGLSTCIRSIWNHHPARLTNAEVDALYELLLPLEDADHAVRRQHVRDVKQTAREAARRPTLICPLCGGDLVVRTARRGPNAGRQFYGCSNYPDCTYTHPL